MEKTRVELDSGELKDLSIKVKTNMDDKFKIMFLDNLTDLNPIHKDFEYLMSDEEWDWESM